MSSINETAQAMGFVNGIAWARDAFENNKLTLVEFNSYEKCHALRNMMSHGSSRDIWISDETLYIAEAFYAAVAAKPAEVSQPEAPAELPKPEEKPRYHPTKTPIRVGDYVIMLRNGKRSWSDFTATADENDQEQRSFQPGYVYRVEDKDLNLYALTAP